MQCFPWTIRGLRYREAHEAARARLSQAVLEQTVDAGPEHALLSIFHAPTVTTRTTVRERSRIR